MFLLKSAITVYLYSTLHVTVAYRKFYNIENTDKNMVSLFNK